MIIPKGKKFQFIGENTEVGGRGLSDAFDEFLANAVADSGIGTDILGVQTDIIVPKRGYLGNAYIGQDVNLNISNTYTRPLEGVLNSIPNLLDIGLRATTGKSIKSSRFNTMKYWTGVDAPDLDFQFIFETQIDSYYNFHCHLTHLTHQV